MSHPVKFFGRLALVWLLFVGVAIGIAQLQNADGEWFFVGIWLIAGFACVRGISRFERRDLAYPVAGTYLGLLILGFFIVAAGT